MAVIYVAFDTRSGQILSVHLGSVAAVNERESAQRHAKIGEAHLGLITVSSDDVEWGMQYKVDVGHNVLVTATSEEGVGFDSGPTGQTS